MKCNNERNGTTSTKSDDTTRAGPTVDGVLPIIDECIGLYDGLKHYLILQYSVVRTDEGRVVGHLVRHLS